MLELIHNRNPEKALALAAPFRLAQRAAGRYHALLRAVGGWPRRVQCNGGYDFEQNKATARARWQLDGKRYAAYVYGGGRARFRKLEFAPWHCLDASWPFSRSDSPARAGPRRRRCKQRGEESSQSAAFPASRLISQSTVLADIGGEIRYLCGVDHARLVSRRLVQA